MDIRKRDKNSAPLYSLQHTWSRTFKATLTVSLRGIERGDQAQDPQEFGQQVQRLLADKWWAQQSGATVSWYKDGDFEVTQGILAAGLTHPDLAVGLFWMSRLRTGSFWTPQRAAGAGLILPSHGQRCTTCGRRIKKGLREWARHWLLRCRELRTERAVWCEELKGTSQESLVGLVGGDVSIQLLGGSFARDEGRLWVAPETQTAAWLATAKYCGGIFPRISRDLWEGYTVSNTLADAHGVR
jgi:hypothetical protein